jgi:hypothetical protein
MRLRAALRHSLAPRAEATPGDRSPETRPKAGPDENGRRSARTLLFRIFGGESPRLRALLPRAESGDEYAENEKKDL